MQFSYNLIKNNKVSIDDKKKISAIYIKKTEINTSEEQNIENEIIRQKIEEKKIELEEKYKEKYKEKCNEIEKDAYQKGYECGEKNGYEDSYKKNNIEIKMIIDEAEKILEEAKIKYNEYLEEKRNDILKLILNTAEKITNSSIDKEKVSLNHLNSIIDEIKNEKLIIIKCNPNEEKDIKNNIELIKENNNIKCDIEILKDPSLEIGNYHINKNEGKIIIGIEETKKEIIKIFNKELQ